MSPCQDPGAEDSMLAIAGQAEAACTIRSTPSAPLTETGRAKQPSTPQVGPAQVPKLHQSATHFYTSRPQ
eukprot:3811813-Amphidinium_carterae.2